ncbi:FIST signal transduction protein [Patescibacteria group bacterium]
MTKVGVGNSREPDSKKAVNEAVQKAFKQAGLKKCDFVFLFATVGYNQEELLKEVRSLTGNVPLAGCSGEGIITQAECNETVHGVGVMVISSDELTFSNYLAENLKEKSKEAGEIIGKAIMKDKPKNPIAIIMLPDGLTCNMKKIFEGIEGVVNIPIPLIGGSSGDNWKFVKTYQYHNNKVLSDAISCVLISGKAKIEIGISHGCVPIGLDKTITKTEGNRIFEIDNKPAYKVLTEYLSPEEAEDFAKAMVYFAIGEPTPKEIEDVYDKYMIRACMSRDEKDNSVTIPTEIPVGSKIRMMRRDPDMLIQKAEAAAKKIKSKLGKNIPKLVFHFDCAGRGKVLFGTEKETRKPITAMQSVLGKDIPWIGLNTFGEIAPVKDKNYLHNYTAIVCVIY